MVAMGFGLGFTIGYNFAQRTTLKMALEQLEDAKADAAKWRDEYLKIAGK